MICFRCGAEVDEGQAACPNCGQALGPLKKSFTATSSQLKALERRRKRAQEASSGLAYAVGDVVAGRYQLQDLLGIGAFGATFRAYDQEIDQSLAFKVVHDHLLQTDEERDRFVDVARNLRKLSQQNIVRYYDADVHDGHAYFTEQLLDGLSLRKVIALRLDRDGRFSPSEVEPIFSQLALALSYVHKTSVHGSIKLNNIILMPDQLKLTDFAWHELIPFDRYAEILRAYRDAGAPELWEEDSSIRDLTPQSDIYSLGVILYQLCTGRPYDADSPLVSDFLGNDEYAQVGNLDEIIRRATSPDPKERYENAMEFSEALSIMVDSDELMVAEVQEEGPWPSDVTRQIQAPDELLDEPSDQEEGSEETVETDGTRVEKVYSLDPDITPLPELDNMVPAEAASQGELNGDQDHDLQQDGSVEFAESADIIPDDELLEAQGAASQQSHLPHQPGLRGIPINQTPANVKVNPRLTGELPVLNVQKPYDPLDDMPTTRPQSIPYASDAYDPWQQEDMSTNALPSVAERLGDKRPEEDEIPTSAMPVVAHDDDIVRLSVQSTRLPDKQGLLASQHNRPAAQVRSPEPRSTEEARPQNMNVRAVEPAHQVTEAMPKVVIPAAVHRKRKGILSSNLGFALCIILSVSVVIGITLFLFSREKQRRREAEIERLNAAAIADAQKNRPAADPVRPNVNPPDAGLVPLPIAAPVPAVPPSADASIVEPQPIKVEALPIPAQPKNDPPSQEPAKEQPKPDQPVPADAPK